jgi:hypothetical protein
MMPPSVDRHLLLPLQVREVFHLEFLRWLSRKLRPGQYALKGGANLRFFFQSPRFSEDMDLDVRDVSAVRLQDVVMAGLGAPVLRDTLSSYGIRELVPPDLRTAKQTDTTQRFEVHLISSSGLDLFTKVGFSRRGECTGAIVEPVATRILREYRMTPLLCPHYSAAIATAQKVKALAERKAIQTRDIFDLFLLDTQVAAREKVRASTEAVRKARTNLFQVEYAQFADSVLAYLTPEDAAVYGSAERWDDIRLAVDRMLGNTVASPLVTSPGFPANPLPPLYRAFATSSGRALLCAYTGASGAERNARHSIPFW